jgi:hypothetical protein
MAPYKESIMRKPRKIALVKETLRTLEEQRLKAVGVGGTDVNCVWPNVGQRTCGISNCGSCSAP